MYGPVDNASDKMRELLGVAMAESLEGEFKINNCLPQDEILYGKFSDILKHKAYLSGGGINTYAIDDKYVYVKAISSDGAERAYATFNNNALSGRLAWVRGSFPSDGNPSVRLPVSFKASEYVIPGSFFRSILSKFGILISFSRRNVDDQAPMVLYSNNNNATYITGYAPDTTCRMRLLLPDGAPVMMGSDCIIKDSIAEYALSRWWHNECRIFVKQKAESKVSCVVKPSVFPGTDRRFYVYGLVEADVIFRKVPGTIVKLVKFPDNDNRDDADKFLDTNLAYTELENNRILCKNITGSLMISWGTGETFRRVFE